MVTVEMVGSKNDRKNIVVESLVRCCFVSRYLIHVLFYTPVGVDILEVEVPLVRWFVRLGLSDFISLSLLLSLCNHLHEYCLQHLST